MPTDTQLEESLSRLDREPPLSRDELSEKLKEWFGRPGAVAAKTLAKYACIGGGPPMFKYGPRVAYPQRPAYEWGRNRRRLVTSTSDQGKVA